MSALKPTRRLGVRDIRSRKGQTPLVVLTAYSAPMARALDPHVDVLLVGDSLGMVLYGLDSTLPVTLEMMIAHGGAVVRGSTRAHVVIDMPFGSYQESPAQAFRSAARLLAETGAGSVKLEGGVEMAETIAFLSQRGAPVMAHIGLKPQSMNAYGGFRTQGRTQDEAEAILADAHAVAAAGAYAVVVEGVTEDLAAEITQAVGIPTIGIGASARCDGQVLVSEDMLGLGGDLRPKFVKTYAALGDDITRAAAAYAADVRSRAFPGAEHVYVTKTVQD